VGVIRLYLVAMGLVTVAWSLYLMGSGGHGWYIFDIAPH
jgi:hypothetical protein